MELYEYFVIAVVMALDAFAVSVCKGVSCKGKMLKTGLVCGLWFGVFQALMPLIGWLFGEALTSLIPIEDVSGYIAFALLSFLGIKMVKESLEKECDCQKKENDFSLAFKSMIIFAIATSIDALAIGVVVSIETANIWLAISLIGIITFVLSFFGAIIGNKIGSKYEKKAELFGGIVLILLGIKFLIETFLG